MSVRAQHLPLPSCLSCLFPSSAPLQTLARYSDRRLTLYQARYAIPLPNTSTSPTNVASAASSAGELVMDGMPNIPPFFFSLSSLGGGLSFEGEKGSGKEGCGFGLGVKAE